MANTIIVPEIFAKEVIRNRDIKNVFYNYANTKYEWELKMQWDTVTVQTLPTLSFTTWWTAWDTIAATAFAITSESLVINQVAQLLVELKNIEIVQSNLSLEQKVWERFAEAEARLLDTVIRDFILNDVDNKIPSGNKLTTIVASKTTIFASIEALKVILAENNVTDNLVLFVSPKVASFLRQSGELDNTDTGWMVRQKGALGLISGFKVVETNALTASMKMIAMQEWAINSVVQLNKYKVTDWVDGFYENLLAEIIYGTKIFGELGKWIATQVYTYS